MTITDHRGLRDGISDFEVNNENRSNNFKMTIADPGRLRGGFTDFRVNKENRRDSIKDDHHGPRGVTRWHHGFQREQMRIEGNRLPGEWLQRQEATTKEK